MSQCTLFMRRVGWFLPVALLTTIGCVTPPDVVLLDHKTALEQQAQGEFHGLQGDLQQAGIARKGEDLTRAQLEAGGDVGASSLGNALALYSAVHSDAEQIDLLLISGCVGEAWSGLVAETPETCKEDLDPAEVTRTLQRVNRNRRQIWRFIQLQTPGASEEFVRSVWRAHHIKRVVCGARIQTSQEAWEVKEC